jgi:hypothetical protein
VELANSITARPWGTMILRSSEKVDWSVGRWWKTRIIMARSIEDDFKPVLSEVPF